MIFLQPEFCTYLIFSFKVNWHKARDWCTERGMQLVTLKTLSQLESVDKELKSRGHSKKECDSDLRLSFQNFALLQIISNSGYLLRTQLGRRLDSISGRTARQWTIPLGQVDNQMRQAQATRCALVYTLEKPNCSTGSVHTMLTSCAKFLLRSPRAFHKIKCTTAVSETNKFAKHYFPNRMRNIFSLQ
jgi:hypothetical protein